MSDVKTKLTLSNGDLIVERAQDCEQIVERNKYLQTVKQRSDWGRHIATVPNVKWEEWLNEWHARGGDPVRWCSPEFEAFVMKKLRDPENRSLRTDCKAPRYISVASLTGSE